MAKRKISKKTNKPINIYDWAGMLDKSGEAFDEVFSKDNAFNSISGIAGAATSILGAAQNNAEIADTSQLEGNINNAKNYVVGASDNDSLMNEWGSWSPMDNVNWKDIRGGSTGQRLTNTIGALSSGISTGVKVGGPIGGIIGGVAGLGSAVAGWISGGAKAKRKARNLNNEIAYANEHNLLSLENKANAIDTQNDLLMMANFAANGGLLDNPYKGTTHIDADSVPMIGTPKDSLDSLNWLKEYNKLYNKKAVGGSLFTNGIITIDNGGTHEYLEGQEYDVTEEEIKLLNKLGYEFEYL